MNRIRGFMLVLVLMLGFAAAACAPPPPRVQEGPPPPPRGGGAGYNIHERIENQQARINQGIASGQLTRGEADILRDNLNWIRNRFRQLSSDGMLTEREAHNLNKMLNENSEMIQQKKHNARRLY